MMAAQGLSLQAPSWPLSPEQRAVAASAAPGLCIGLGMGLDVAKFQRAVEGVTQRHSVLSHRFVELPGYRGLRQQPDEEGSRVEWEAVDERPQGPRPWDLARGPLLRGTLSRTAQGEWQWTLSAHPLVMDRLSLRTLAQQVAQAYASHAAQPADEPFQYAQFIDWRQDLLEDDDAKAGQAYWTAHLADAPAPLRLVHRRDGDASPIRLQAVAAMDAARVRSVLAVAARHGVTTEAWLHATWCLLLARLAQRADFTTGWQHDCRVDYEPMQGALGVYDKVLPIRVQLDLEAPFQSWAQRCAATMAAHVEAQEYAPLTAMEAPTAGFAFEQVATLAGGWQWSELSAPTAAFELALEASWSEHGAVLTITADSARYCAAAAERLLMQFQTLLTATLADATTPVGLLPLVGPAEQEALLALNAGRLDVEGPSVADRIDHWAHTTPDAPALAFAGERLSYAQLQARADAAARWMQAEGVGAGSLVALNLPRSLDGVVAMLAAWRLRAGYLPLEPEWPEARRQAVLADAKPALVVNGALPALPPVDDPVTPFGAPQADDVAYVLYTSGSTGSPKGVVIEHGALLNYVAAASDAMDLACVRRWALTSTVAADLGHTALFGALFNGACLVIAEPADLQDGASFARFIARAAIDGLKIVPSHLEALLGADDRVPLPRTLVLGGEAAPRALIERIAQLAPEGRIFNHYGPTETTVGVMVHAVAPTDVERHATLPLTRVLANNRVLVLDANQQLAAAGSVGELYIGGRQVCRGYLNRPTEQAFVSDPFRPAERLYRTGDLACVLPEGGVRLVGRADHQLKVRGYRVEPGEIEAALLGLPGVRQAAVLPVGEGSALELVACLVLDGAVATSEADRRERLAAQLPAHMLPARYATLPALPRLANGKVDRLALAREAARAVAEGQQVREGVPPRNAVEGVLLACTAELLGGRTVGVDDDFFDLGGHSLLVIKLVARIRKLLKVEIAPSVVFEHPSVAALALALRQHAPDVSAMERLAEAQQQLARMSPEQREALLARASQPHANAAT